MKNRAYRKAFVFAGVLLLAAAMSLFLFGAWKSATQREELSEAMLSMQELFNDSTAGLIGDWAGEDMPQLEIDGRNYIGLLEVPECGIALPVAAAWETGLFPFRPARYSGTLYNDSLVIGGSNAEDSFAFIGQLDAGDWVNFTDVQGIRYVFAVSKITHNTTIDIDELRSFDTPLLLFTKKDDSYLVAHLIAA